MITDTQTITALRDLPDHARVWVYQSNRGLSDKEIEFIQQSAAKFLKDWNTHGSEMTATLLVAHHRFIILAADESLVAASGCSIDSSVRFFKALEQELNINLFDRMQIAYYDKTGAIKTKSLSDFEAAVQAGEITGETIVFNNLIKSLGELKTDWEVPASQSWHARMLN